MKTDLQKDLETARQELQTLAEESPQYHELLDENQRQEAKLKEERAPLDDLAQARGRVGAARELLAQHEADLSTAQAQVTHLEAQLDQAEREATWTAMLEERRAIEDEWNERVTDLTRQYLEGLQALEPLLERRRRYFERLPAAAKGVGLRDQQIERHFFSLYLQELQTLETFNPHFRGGGCTLTVGQGRGLFRVAVESHV